MTNYQKRKYNIKLYPLYKMFSWDLLFYYAIIYLFLTIEKGLDAPTVLILESICQFSKIILQPICININDMFGTRRSLIISHIIIAFSLLVLILSKELSHLIIFNILYAFGYGLKQLCESSMLYSSLPSHSKRNFFFSKIDGFSSSIFYFFDAVSMLIAGFLFTINGYLPIIACIAFKFVSIIFSLQFYSVEAENNITFNKKQKESIKKYLHELNNILKFILQSKRLKCLLLYSGLFTGLLTLLVSLRSIVLTDINLPEEYFGIIFAAMQLIAGISSKLSVLYHKILKNKTLTYFALTLTISMLLLGLIITCNLPYQLIFIVTITWLIIYSSIKGPFQTCIKQYLHSFVDTTVNTKIYAIQTVIDSAFSISFVLISAFLLSITSTALTLIIISSVLLTFFVLLLDYMKSYVGLKPEEYKKSEIIYTELK